MHRFEITYFEKYREFAKEVERRQVRTESYKKSVSVPFIQMMLRSLYLSPPSLFSHDVCLHCRWRSCAVGMLRRIEWWELRRILYIFRESIMILVERASEDEVYKVINLIARLSIQSKVVDSCIYILPPQQPTNVRTITCHCWKIHRISSATRHLQRLLPSSERLAIPHFAYQHPW